MTEQFDVFLSGVATGGILTGGMFIVAIFAFLEGKRSAAAQRGLPSANCSAEARAEAQPDSLISSVVPPKEAVRQEVQHDK